MNIFKKKSIRKPKSAFFQYLQSHYRVASMFCDVNGVFYLGASFLAGSRLFKIVSLFLPIKVLIIQSQNELPSYFNFLIKHITHHELVIFLALFIPITYFVYVGFGVIYNIFYDRDKIKQKEKFVNVLETKWSEVKFHKFHKNITESVAEIFTILISFVLVLLYSVSFLLLFLVSTGLMYIFIFKYILPMKSADRVTFLKLDRVLLIEYVTSLSFLFVFFIVFIKMYNSDLDVLGAVYIIMLSRICFQSLGRFSRKGMQLQKNIPEFIKNVDR